MEGGRGYFQFRFARPSGSARTDSRATQENVGLCLPELPGGGRPERFRVPARIAGPGMTGKEEHRKGNAGAVPHRGSAEIG
jgi:hypothetical protein